MATIHIRLVMGDTAPLETEDSFIIYDREEHTAWIQCDVSVDLRANR